LSQLSSPLEEITFHSMMSDHRMRSAQKQRRSEYLHVEAVTTNPSDENISLDEDFLTPMEVLDRSRRRNSFSPGEENKQPDATSREEQLAAWKADRHRRMSDTAAKPSNQSFRNSTPCVNCSSIVKPPLVQTQQLGEKSMQPHSANSKAMVRSHTSLQEEQPKPRYSIATFSSSLSGLPPKNTSSIGRNSQEPRSNSKPDAHWHRGYLQAGPPLIPKPSHNQLLDSKSKHAHLNTTIESDQGCVNSMYQSPRSCSASDTSKCAGRRCSLPIRRSCSMVLFSKSENEQLTRKNALPGRAKRRASIGTNPLERLSSKAAAQRMNERLSIHSSPSQMIVNISSSDPSASPLTCSVCSGSACDNEDDDDDQIDDDMLQDFHGVVRDDLVDDSASKDSPQHENLEESVLLSDTMMDSVDLFSTKHPALNLPQQQLLKSSSDMTDHELEEILAQNVESDKKDEAQPVASLDTQQGSVDENVISSVHFLVGADASVELCILPGDGRNGADASMIATDDKLPEPSKEIGPISRVERLPESRFSSAKSSSTSASFCFGQDINIREESDSADQAPILATSSTGEEMVKELLNDERLMENGTEGDATTKSLGQCFAENEANACLVQTEGSFGSFEEGIVKAYRVMKKEDVSHETVAKASYSIEEECPQLTSALLELEAFDWRDEILSPEISELPERRRTDATQLFLSARSRSTSEDILSPPVESLPLETPTSQVSDGSFDWRKEVQSPFLQPQQKRRMRTSILSSIHSRGHHSPDCMNHVDASYHDIFLNDMLHPVATNEIEDCVETACPTIVSTPTKATASIEGNLNGGTQKSPFHSKVPSPLPDELTRKVPVNLLFDENGAASDIADPWNEKPDELPAPIFDKEEGAFDLLFEVAELIKVNGRSVLSTIPEDSVDVRKVVLAEVTHLLSENRKFQDQIYEMRKCYDDRITPFRNLFDERRKITVDKARLAKERTEMEAQLAEKQQKITVTVQLSIEKVRFLQSKLNEARQENEILSERIAKIQLENEHLKHEIDQVNFEENSEI
jgi:hypothetical protein